MRLTQQDVPQRLESVAQLHRAIDETTLLLRRLQWLKQGCLWAGGALFLFTFLTPWGPQLLRVDLLLTVFVLLGFGGRHSNREAKRAQGQLDHLQQTLQQELDALLPLLKASEQPWSLAELLTLGEGLHGSQHDFPELWAVWETLLARRLSHSTPPELMALSPEQWELLYRMVAAVRTSEQLLVTILLAASALPERSQRPLVERLRQNHPRPRVREAAQVYLERGQTDGR